MRTTLLILIAALALVGGGCSQDNEPLYVNNAEVYQKYDYDTVKKKSADLRKGMPKIQVMILLGSPAKQENTEWTYLPDRSGLIVPAESLVVYFQDGRVTQWKTKAIVLGEQI